LKLSKALRKKGFLLILMYSFASILCCLTVPIATAPSSTVTFRVENVTSDALGLTGLVMADIYIDAPDPESAIVGWTINIKVNPDVLEPGYDFGDPYGVFWAVSGMEGYFLYDWCKSGGRNYTIMFEEGAIDVTAGTITGTIEAIAGWAGLEPGVGANGTGKLVTFFFTSKNETAYSPIEITEAYYYTSWKVPDLDKRIPDIIIHGHYNEPTFDVAVTSVSAPSQATVGDIVTINVTVANLGGPVALNLTLTYNRTIIETRLMSLASATSKTESFAWDTTGLTPGEYVINATAIVPEDVDLTNNFNITMITLLAHDVAITNITASSFRVDINVTISVGVANEGDFPETFNVTITYDSEVIGTKPVTLSAGDSKTVKFDWDVRGVALRKYNITAEAILDGDADLEDNTMTSEWSIEIIPEYPTEIPLLLVLVILAVSMIILKQRTQREPLKRRLMMRHGNTKVTEG